MTNRIQKIIVILIVAATQSCNIGTSGTWKNENIKQEKREQIKELNDKLFKAIINKDVEVVKLLMSKTLLEKGTGDLSQLLDQVSSSIKTESYRVLDEYNVYNTAKGIGNTLLSGVTGDNDYQVNYQALNEEMYASLLIPNSPYNELLITIIYGNYGSEWKINILQFGQYSIFKKTSIDYYKLAKDSYDKSFLIDAVNYIGISKQCLKPANNFFKYQKEGEVNEFYNKVMKEANTRFHFPLALDNIKTKPRVFRIYPEATDNGFCPMVLYLSNINLKDTTALKVENEKIRKEISLVFTGIDKEKKFVFYRAFNEIPDGKRQIDHYGFVDKR